MRPARRPLFLLYGVYILTRGHVGRKLMQTKKSPPRGCTRAGLANRVVPANRKTHPQHRAHRPGSQAHPSRQREIQWSGDKYHHGYGERVRIPQVMRPAVRDLRLAEAFSGCPLRSIEFPSIRQRPANREGLQRAPAQPHKTVCQTQAARPVDTSLGTARQRPTTRRPGTSRPYKGVAQTGSSTSLGWRLLPTG